MTSPEGHVGRRPYARKINAQAVSGHGFSGVRTDFDEGYGGRAPRSRHDRTEFVWRPCGISLGRKKRTGFP